MARLELIFRKTVLGGIGEHRAPTGPGLDDLGIRAVEIDPARSGDQPRHQAEMIRMQVGDEKIGFIRIDFQFLESGLHHLETLIPVQPRVDHQIPPGRSNHVGVEKFERAVGQRHSLSGTDPVVTLQSSWISKSNLRSIDFSEGF